MVMMGTVGAKREGVGMEGRIMKHSVLEGVALWQWKY